MSSKADDFDVRYRDVGTAGDVRPAADGGYRGGAGDVDYDLGYDAEGWDTQGFRRPEADYLDSREPGYADPIGAGAAPAGAGNAGAGVGTAVRADRWRTLRGRREGSHARTAGNDETSQLSWEADTAAGLWTPETPGHAGHRRRTGRSRRPARAAGPLGLRRPAAPRAEPDRG